jgi:hypothetical protein
MREFVLILLSLLSIWTKVAGQCTNTSAYGSATAPASGCVTITTAQYAGEYATISGVAATTGYQSTSSVSTDYITIREGAYNGTLIASGTTPLNWTSTVAGTYYMHTNTNSSCGSQASNRTTQICVNSTAHKLLQAMLR